MIGDDDISVEYVHAALVRETAVSVGVGAEPDWAATKQLACITAGPWALRYASKPSLIFWYPKVPKQIRIDEAVAPASSV